jgi:predicted Zn-dependent peptidase
MKNNIYIMITMLFVSAGLSAQIDRSQPPKPGPAPKISLDKPVEFKLDNGMTVMIVENHKLPKVTYSLRLHRKPEVEAQKAGLAGLFGNMMGNGTLNIPKDKFNDEVDYLGARLVFNEKGGFATSLTDYSDRILELLADGAINPLFTEEEFDKERTKMIEGLKSSEKNVSSIASRINRAVTFGEQHPFGEFNTEETLNNIALSDIKTYYKDHFHPAESYLVIIGDIKPEEAKKRVRKYFGKWKKGTLKNIKVPEPISNPVHTEIDFVDVSNAVQSNISLANIVKLRMKDPDYHAVLIANEILGGGFGGYLNMNLREKHAYTYGSYSYINSSEYAGRFQTTAKVRNAVTDSSVVETIKEIRRIRKEHVDPKILKNTKANYTGKFILSLEKPETMAEFAMDIKLKDLPGDFYSTYLEKIDAVSAADVQRVAKKYFLVDNAHIIVVGKGSEVLKNLEKTGIPIKYYDKWANPVQKPDYNAALPADVTVTSIIDHYIKAIGGKSNVDKVKTVLVKADAEVQPGMILSLDQKKTAKGQFYQDVSAMGNSMSKQVYDGEKGYIVVQGQKRDLTAEEVKKIKDQTQMFPEMSYASKGAKVIGVENINGKKAYKIKVSDELTAYYGISSGLRLKEERTVPGGLSEIYYSDYKEINGVRYPFKMEQHVGPQKFDFIVKEYKVNEGISDEDFK